jgi:Kef-type K+ transport system membrane component KefB
LRTLLAGIGLYVIGQILTWFQTNGQFISPWIKNNTLIVSMVGGTVISYAFIRATALIAEYYDGLIWPGRFMGFSIGIVAFAILTKIFMDEGIDTKTVVSLCLAFALICVQILWK